MRRFFHGLAFASCFLWAIHTEAGTGRVMKVLPHFLDLQGRHTLHPSLYERDAYQAVLREHPEKRSGIRFDVEWRSRGAVWEPLTLRVELRGIAKGNVPKELVIEKQVKPESWFGQWTSFPVIGKEYQSIGDVTGWR